MDTSSRCKLRRLNLFQQHVQKPFDRSKTQSRRLMQASHCRCRSLVCHALMISTMRLQLTYSLASFNERLLLSNGLSVSPIHGPGGQSSSSQRSLRQAASSIDNEKDLNDYVTAQHRSVPPNAGEIKYERNPVSNLANEEPVSQITPFVGS